MNNGEKKTVQRATEVLSGIQHFQLPGWPDHITEAAVVTTTCQQEEGQEEEEQQDITAVADAAVGRGGGVERRGFVG